MKNKKCKYPVDIEDGKMVYCGKEFTPIEIHGFLDAPNDSARFTDQKRYSKICPLHHAVSETNMNRLKALKK